MNSTITAILYYLLIPVALGVIRYVWKQQQDEIAHLEERIICLEKDITSKLIESQVRQIIADKIDPISEDLQQLSTKLDRIYEFLIKK